MKTKAVSELSPAELDWVVGIIGGIYKRESVMPFVNWFKPSTNWAQGGPIIEREKISVEPYKGSEGMWLAVHGEHYAYGDTPLVAAIRAYVQSKMGDEIQVPEVA